MLKKAGLNHKILIAFVLCVAAYMALFVVESIVSASYKPTYGEDLTGLGSVFMLIGIFFISIPSAIGAGILYAICSSSKNKSASSFSNYLNGFMLIFTVLSVPFLLLMTSYVVTDVNALRMQHGR